GLYSNMIRFRMNHNETPRESQPHRPPDNKNGTGLFRCGPHCYSYTPSPPNGSGQKARSLFPAPPFELPRMGTRFGRGGRIWTVDRGELKSCIRPNELPGDV